MAKRQSVAVKAKEPKSMAEVTKELKANLPPNGEFHRPFPWVEPYPESKPDEDGKETIFVRATSSQDIILNGIMRSAGEHTVPCDFAHSHAAVMSAPKSK